MDFSKNPHAPLGDIDSSKEQKTQVARTGTEDTGDQMVQRTDQPDTSAEEVGMLTGGLDSLPHVPTLDELFELALKRGLALVDAEEKEKGKKLRQGNSSRYVGDQSPSAAPQQGLRKRTAPFHEAKDSSKRRRVRPFPQSQAVAEPDIATPTTVSDSKTEEPAVAKGGDPSASALVVPEAPVLSPPSTFRWADIRNPRELLLCIVQANDSKPIGSFAEDTEDWAFHLTFDAGRWRIPTMTMRFFSNGLLGPQCGQTGWCLGDYIENGWMVTDFKIHRVADCPENENQGIRHRDVLAACKTDEDMARLICISLEAWPKILGLWRTKDLRRNNPKPGVNKFFSNVFTGRHPYQSRIWFLAPDDLKGFEKKCLSFFTRYFEQRRVPHYGLYDADDVCFADHLKAQEEASST